MGPCIVNVFFKYNQQDATLYNIFYYLPTCLLAATASGGSKQARHIPDAVCAVFELLMMGGKTARNI